MGQNAKILNFSFIVAEFLGVGLKFRLHYTGTLGPYSKQFWQLYFCPLPQKNYEILQINNSLSSYVNFRTLKEVVYVCKVLAYDCVKGQRSGPTTQQCGGQVCSGCLECSLCVCCRIRRSGCPRLSLFNTSHSQLASPSMNSILRHCQLDVHRQTPHRLPHLNRRGLLTFHSH